MPVLKPSGPAGVWTSYRTLLQWTLIRIGGTVLPLVVVQALLAAGIIVGFGLLIPNIDTSSARFLATGTPIVVLMIIRLVMVPSGVAETAPTAPSPTSVPCPSRDRCCSRSN